MDIKLVRKAAVENGLRKCRDLQKKKTLGEWLYTVATWSRNCWKKEK